MQELNPLVGNWKLVSRQTIVHGAAAPPGSSDELKGLPEPGPRRAHGPHHHRREPPGRDERHNCTCQCLPLTASTGSKVAISSFLVDVSWDETWNGTELKRPCRIEGD